ncbi:hypothetical protein [Stieleria varia]|uniref:hypothetical protein n=1 Tax=Stieleria varia TaxID=2528005 RepID=UPI0011B74C2D|nr:hypothetical protein [Stieleria varia]
MTQHDLSATQADQELITDPAKEAFDLSLAWTGDREIPAAGSFVGDPNAESFSAAVGVSTIAAKDAYRSDGFVREILLVVAFVDAVSIQRPGVLAVWTGGTFEQGELLVALYCRSKNPSCHHGSPEFA